MCSYNWQIHSLATNLPECSPEFAASHLPNVLIGHIKSMIWEISRDHLFIGENQENVRGFEAIVAKPGNYNVT